MQSGGLRGRLSQSTTDIAGNDERLGDEDRFNQLIGSAPVGGNSASWKKREILNRLAEITTSSNIYSSEHSEAKRILDSQMTIKDQVDIAVMNGCLFDYLLHAKSTPKWDEVCEEVYALGRDEHRKAKDLCRIFQLYHAVNSGFTITPFADPDFEFSEKARTFLQDTRLLQAMSNKLQIAVFDEVSLKHLKSAISELSAKQLEQQETGVTSISF